MHEEILKKKVKQTEEEIATANIMIDFLNWMAEQEKEDKEKSATYKVKADQMNMSKKINEKFIEYVKGL